MSSPVLLFDGVCNLCNGIVVFILKFEKEPIIKFTALQSEAGISILKKHNIHPETGRETIIFIEDDKVMFRSKAAIKISKHLKKPYSFAAVFKIFPWKFLDFFYIIISNNRYKIFGKTGQCMIPNPKWNNRFLN